MFSEIVDGFGVKIPAATVTTIVKEPGWTPNELILICSEKNGRSWVLVRRTQDEQKQKQIIVRFEDDLAARLNTVITYELLRSEGSPHRRPAFDTDSYLFSQTERPALIGETGGDNKNSTVGYLCHVADLISEYCHSDAGEHTRLLGEIDRAVTAIEIAYRKVK
ncbi:MAG TPA: hypothetical protein VHD61_15850 [Lacunisphaera sp.]|nr:hypothetical protein [Lacunisphaera sp.]